MANKMRYIQDLEAAGIPRKQAEAQFQFVMDVMADDFATKKDLALFQEKTEHRFSRIDARFDQIDARFDQMEARFEQIDAKFGQMEDRFERRLIETQFQLFTRLGALMVSTTTIAVAVLGWLIKMH